MNNPMMRMLMQRLKLSNPQGFQQVQTMMQNGGNPMGLLKQILGGKSPEQLNSFFGTMRNMGFSDDVLKQVQDGINSN